MLKKTITYTDFNDEEVSEDHYFHLSKAELVEIELSHKGGLSESLKKIIESEDGKAIIAEFKNIILGSYGKRSDDGKRFVKTQELREEFESSEAYSTLFMELVTNTDSAVEFVNGIIPKGMAEEAAKIVGADLTVVPEATPELETAPTGPILEESPLGPVETNTGAPETKPEPVVLSRVDVAQMSTEEFQALGARLESGEVVIEQLPGK